MNYLFLSVTFCTSVVRFLPTCKEVLTILRNISGQRNAVRSLQGKKHFKVTVGWFYIYVGIHIIKKLKYQQKHLFCKKHQTKARRNFAAILYSGFVKVNFTVNCWCFIHRRLFKGFANRDTLVLARCPLLARFVRIFCGCSGQATIWFISPKLG